MAFLDVPYAEARISFSVYAASTRDVRDYQGCKQPIPGSPVSLFYAPEWCCLFAEITWVIANVNFRRPWMSGTLRAMSRLTSPLMHPPTPSLRNVNTPGISSCQVPMSNDPNLSSCKYELVASMFLCLHANKTSGDSLLVPSRYISTS